jgi:hypothetical protein
LRDAAEHFTRKGIQTTPEEVRDLILDQARQFSEKKTPQNAFVQELLTFTNMIREMLLSKPWQIWHAPAGAEFVTSDNPLVTFVKLTPELWHPGHGLRIPNSFAAFPVCSSACVMIGTAGKEHERIDETTVNHVNEIVIRCSDSFVYSKMRSTKIAELVNKIGRTSVPGQTAFVGSMPDEDRIEEYLRRHMGIRAPLEFIGGLAVRFGHDNHD